MIIFQLTMVQWYELKKNQNKLCFLKYIEIFGMFLITIFVDFNILLNIYVFYLNILSKSTKSASITMFCCIKSIAIFVDSVSGHMRVGPKTIAKFGMCIRLNSL